MTILVPAGFRSQVLAAFPITIRKRCRADIGVLILFIGRVNAGFVRPPVASMPVVDGAVAGSPTPPVALGQRSGIPVLPAGVGLAVAALLTARRVRGALRIAILAPTSLAFFTHFLTGAGVSKALGFQSGVPPSFPTPSFATVGAGIIGRSSILPTSPNISRRCLPSPSCH